MLDRRLALCGLLAIAFAAGLALLAITAVSFDWQEGARAQTTSVIEVGDLWFCDSSFQNGVCETTVNVGDTVEWQWVGSAAHTTTECAGDLDACPEPHLWDSPVQTSGTFSFAFDSAGTFVYRCQIHTTAMRGQIIVLAAEQPTPTSSPIPTPTPTPAEVPAGGGPPAAGPGTPVPWWLFLVAGGGLLMSAAIALAVRSARPA